MDQHTRSGTVGSHLEVVLPEAFSIMDAPEATFAVIKVVASARRGCSRVIVDGRGLVQLDTGAASVLVALLLEARLRGVDVDLLLPKSDAVKRRLAVGGASRLLRAEDRGAFPRASLLALHAGGRNPSWDDKEREDYVKRDALRIRDRLLQWVLTKKRCQLASMFEGRLSVALNEAIENASVHTPSDWWISAHIDTEDGDARVETTVFNFGRSVVETFHGVPSDNPTLVEYEWLREEHEKREGFDGSWTPDNLLTVLAIQDGSTSRFVRHDRGAGTLKWIHFFEYLSRSGARRAPRMCWTSGSTHIVMDGRYRLQESTLDERPLRRDLAFNMANDLRLRPDPGAVTNLGTTFPGMLITAQFDLCEAFLDCTGDTT